MLTSRGMLTVRIPRGGSYWNLNDQDRIELWRGLERLGTFSVATLAALLEHHVLLMASHIKLAQELQSPPLLPPARKALAALLSHDGHPPPEEIQAARRQARRSRKPAA